MSLILVITNTTPESTLASPEGISTYRWEARINTKVIARGEGLKHLRRLGWAELVRKVAFFADTRLPVRRL